jgi:hypothetical protein
MRAYKKVLSLGSSAALDLVQNEARFQNARIVLFLVALELRRQIHKLKYGCVLVGKKIFENHLESGVKQNEEQKNMSSSHHLALLFAFN